MQLWAVAEHLQGLNGDHAIDAIQVVELVREGLCENRIGVQAVFREQFFDLVASLRLSRAPGTHERLTPGTEEGLASGLGVRLKNFGESLSTINRQQGYSDAAEPLRLPQEGDDVLDPKPFDHVLRIHRDAPSRQ